MNYSALNKYRKSSVEQREKSIREAMDYEQMGQESLAAVRSAKHDWNRLATEPSGQLITDPSQPVDGQPGALSTTTAENERRRNYAKQPGAVPTGGGAIIATTGGSQHDPDNFMPNLYKPDHRTIEANRNKLDAIDEVNDSQVN